MLNGKVVLITGGTGSLGKQITETLLRSYDIKKVIIYSRDELKQYNMCESAEIKPHYEQNKVRFFIGDVRDEQRLQMAMQGVDYVIHTAALKQVPSCEYNPFEAIKTNVLGGQNVITAALAQKVKRVIALSTDKAAAPINLYGATKLCSDKLFTAANNYRGENNIAFSVVRYGNVMGSRGSVIPLFLTQKKTGTITMTDPRMTRFNITLSQAVDFVLFCLQNMIGGEIFVPKIPSYRLTDVAAAIAPEAQIKSIGIRPGEKLHEEMITETDALNSIEFDKHFTIMPSSCYWSSNPNWQDEYRQNGKTCEYGFSYNSGNNSDFLTVEEIRTLIEENKPLFHLLS